MSITTYSQLMVELNRLIDGENVTVSDVPLATLQSIVGLGERMVYREVRSRHNEKAFSAVTVTSNLAPLPADWESTSLVHFGGKPLSSVTEEWLRVVNANGLTGDARYFAQAGGSLMFGPAVADGTAVQGRYFARLPDLAVATLPTNALFLADPDLFIYAALAKSGPFFEQDARVPLWTAEYSRIRDAINTAHDRAAFSAGRVQIRPSVNMIG